MKRCVCILLFVIVYSSQLAMGQAAYQSLTSPDRKIVVQLMVQNGQAFYSITYNAKTIIEKSSLGLVRDDEDFSTSLAIKNAGPIKIVSDKYNLSSGKKHFITYTANSRTFSLLNKNRQPLDITFNVSNDGVAFRYYFPNKSSDVKRVTEEKTTFNFPDSARAFLQPMSEPKSGWEQTNPAYEEHYKQDMIVGTTAPGKAGWVYPALFKDNSTWVLITEAALDSNYCASRLQQESAGGEYHLGFPGQKEVIKVDGLLPRSTLPFYSPWRVITMGSLKTIVESTLGTDLANPAKSIDTSFIKPGKASWSWINSKDNFIVYKEQKKYIDFAADMHWQYCLIDADWDRKIGYDSVKILADYAKKKNVGLLLWFNSAGDWNTVKYTPRNKLLTHGSRMQEFARLQAMGIKGVKIDFFGGDGQSVIRYYIDILNDAATYKLMVNFHGATLPRGWHRTYPHLMTTEAVRGFEMVTFNQADANVEANHCAMLPFTRNAFDPMDFTPMNLYKINTQVKRQTSSAFELALSVLFLSGIQHYAESPDGMMHVPEFAKQFVRNLPDSWDDVKFIDGYPGKYVVIARKAGNKWYVAGINGESEEKHFSLDLSSLRAKRGTMITDGEQEMFSESRMHNVTKHEIKLKPNGGFVMVLE